MREGIIRNDIDNLQGCKSILENERGLLIYGGYLSIEAAEAITLVIDEVEDKLKALRTDLQLLELEQQWRQEAHGG